MKAVSEWSTVVAGAAVVGAPRDWWFSCVKEKYPEGGYSWLILFPLGAIAPIECGAAHTLATTIVAPVILLPFGIAFAVLFAPIAAARPNDFCDEPEPEESAECDQATVSHDEPIDPRDNDAEDNQSSERP